MTTARTGTARVMVLRVDDAAWDASLADVARDFYHLAGYHGWARDRGEGEPFMVVVGDSGQGLAWPYLLRDISSPPGLTSSATDISSVYGYPGPLAWGCQPGDAFIARAWAEVRAVWREQGAVAAFTRFHPLIGNAALLADATGLPAAQDQPEPVVRVGPTVSIDCRLSDEDARSQYARALRQHIAAARRAGFATTHDLEWRDLPAFADLYRETMARNRAAESYDITLSGFERLREALAGHVHLLVTRSADGIGAAGLFTEIGGIVQAHLVATSQAFWPLSPCKVLLDDARAWAGQRGSSVLHLGGGRGGREDSLFSFKKEFSNRRHDFHVGRWVLDGPAYRDLVVQRESRLAGALIDQSFFPRYRAPAVHHAERAAPVDCA